MKKFNLVDKTNNTVVSSTLASSLKEAKEFWSYIINDTPVKLSVVEVGVFVRNRVIHYKDLVLVSIKELKSIPDRMLNALINKDFSNDNQTFFMLERGLVTSDRDTLSGKGQELFKAWEN